MSYGGVNMLNHIEAAVFDLDGTLVNSLIVWDVLWSELGKRFLNDSSFKPSEKEDKNVRTMTLKEAMEYINSIYNLTKMPNEVFEAATEVIREFYASEVKLKKGVDNFLEWCFSKNIKMCIASATEKELINIALEHCGIKKYFDKILSCADIKKGKEEPDIYLASQKIFGCSADKICVFEDSLVALTTAKKIGMKTVGIYDKFNYGQEDIRRLADAYIAEGETLEKLI
jgi:HAD superfamily hydrolase (TIGR01509 family)